MNLFDYRRRETGEVQIGGKPLGGNHPIRVQSMTNTSTMDTEACVAQTLRIAEAGGDYVRLTTQGVREAENLRNINAGVRAAGCAVPLVADVHFNPKVADVAALYAEKVRINPGNYVDAARTFKHLEYTDEEYAQELKKIEERFVPFLRICRENHTAIRIGVNHGSLSDRIMSRYGDTPEGIVESCMEFLRICVKEDFKDVVVSIKASNTVVMVRSVRLLVDAMEREGMRYEQTAVGDKYVAENMMANNYSIGGEQSGHIIFSRYAATGDGILTSLMVMEACVDKKSTLCDLAKEMKVYPQVLRNVRVADKKTARENPKVVEAVEAAGKALGDSGRILVRESGTEPLIRVMVEAGTDDLCHKYVDSVVDVMEAEGLVVE